MSQSWSGKRVVVIGGSAGLGLAIARKFAAQGAKLILVARDENRLRIAAETIGGDILTIAADVTRDDDVERMTATIHQELGDVDVVACVAGKSDRGKVLDTSPEQMQQLLELNFLSVVRCTRALAPSLRRRRGHLVLIGSLASKSAARFLGAYPASKFPLAAYAQQLRLEVPHDELNVLLVCPGPIRRDDAGVRYAQQAADLPESAKSPGGGVKLKGLDPDDLARRIVVACERRKLELVIPGRARLLFAISALFPALGDWILSKMMRSS